MYKTVLAHVSDGGKASLNVRSSNPSFDLPDEILIHHAKEAFVRTKELSQEKIENATFSVLNHFRD